MRKQDCGQVTDGGAVILLATESYTHDYALKNNINIESIPYIKGWGTPPPHF